MLGFSCVKEKIFELLRLDSIVYQPHNFRVNLRSETLIWESKDLASGPNSSTMHPLDLEKALNLPDVHSPYF